MSLEDRTVTIGHLGVCDACGVAVLEELAALKEAGVTELCDGIKRFKEGGLHERVWLDASDEVTARAIELRSERYHLPNEKVGSEK